MNKMYLILLGCAVCGMMLSVVFEQYWKKTKSVVFLLPYAALYTMLAGLLCAQVIGIYQEGMARRAENPLASIYTPEIVMEKLSPLAPLFFIAIGFVIGWLLYGAKDESAGKPVRDAKCIRDLIAARVAQPSSAMRGERRVQLLLLLGGWSAFIACMIPLGLYMLDPAHYPLEDLEGMFYALLWVFLPWECGGVACLAVTGSLWEKSLRRETEAAKALIRSERRNGTQPKPRTEKRQMRQGAVQAVVLAAAIVFIIIGIFNGSALDVLTKAIKICTECIGLG